MTIAAIGAVDMALGDIKGKARNTPVYNLLRDENRTGVLVYGHANGRDIEVTTDRVAEHKKLDHLGRSPACRVYPRPTEWPRASCSTSLRRKGCRRRMSGLVRNIFCTSPSGTRSHLLHDVHHRLTPIEAARLGKSLEPYALAAR